MEKKVLFLVTLSVLSMAVQGKWKRIRIKKSPSVKIPNRIPESACRKIVTSSPESFYKSFKNLDGPLCLRLNETQLLEKLKKVGDFNPRYMAVTRQDALHFADLTESAQDLPKKYPKIPKIPKIPKKWFSLTGDTDQDDANIKVESPKATVVRSCLNKGTPVSNQLTLMCTECPVTTQLPVNVFPQFINEVVCHETDRACLPSVGQCGQGILKFTFLHTTGLQRDDSLSIILGVDVYVEVWEDFTQDVGSSCNCLAFATV